MAKGKRKKKAIVELVLIEFKCSNHKKNILIEAKNLEWCGHSDLCDLCGSHGSIEVSFKCPCGETHTVELDSW